MEIGSYPGEHGPAQDQPQDEGGGDQIGGNPKLSDAPVVALYEDQCVTLLLHRSHAGVSAWDLPPRPIL